MKQITFLLLSLFFSLQLPAQPMSVLWEIGTNNQSGEEFALGPFNYGGYADKFGLDPVMFEIGKNNIKTDFPFVLPGPSDAWAGSKSKQLVIRFGLDDVDESCPALLEINYVEVHQHNPPVLQIMVNGHQVKQQAPRGEDHLFFSNKKPNTKGLKTVVEVPAGVLKKGNNLVAIQSSTGSWLVFDNITFSTGKPLKLGKTSPGIDMLIADPKPALIYGKGDELRQPVEVQVVNWGRPVNVNLAIDGVTYEKVKLQPGLNTFETSVPETRTEKNVELSLSSGSKLIGKQTVQSFPVRHWTIYMVQHTHTDIGYTKPQTEILAEHIRYIDYAIEYCEQTEDYPDDAKFKWICEASWPVKEYLKSRPREQVDKFIKYVKNGQIEVTGMFFNMAEIVDENSFKTFLEPIREFKELGIPVVSAMQNDVNGIAWCLADYMPDLGVKYFSMGENGHRALIPFHRATVYKWESPSGNSSYSYRSDHYMTGNSWGIDRVDYETMAPNVFNYIDIITKHGYPFDAIAVQYSGYSTDNSPPSRRESDVIRDWNNKYATPKLRSSLFHEFMDYIVEKYDDQLPVIRAAYPDWWTDGFGSAARETAAARSTHADMITIQGMLAMAVTKGQVLPADITGRIRHIHENLLFYDEHTYGASESITDPTCDNSMVQWAEKSSYAWEALKNTQIMYETAAGLLQTYVPRGEKPTVTFYNTLNWKRSGMVELYIDHDIIPHNKKFRIVDDKGKALKAQPLRSRSEGTYYAIYVEDIPPMGYKTYRIIAEPENRPGLPAASIIDNQIENDYFKITIDPAAGSIKSLYDKQLGIEMVDAGSPWLLGAFVYETLDNRQQLERYRLTDYQRNGLHQVSVSGGNNGPVYQSFFIRGKSDGCEEGPGISIEVRLFHHEKRIELHYAARKLPLVEPDGIYVAFPFQLDQAKLYFDVQGGVVSSGENQIENTASDWNTVQNFVAARNQDAQFIVGSDAIPLFQLGGICTGQFQRKKTYEKPHVYSWVTNNYWTTNFRATQEGELRWSYYLTSSDDVSNTVSTKFGWSSRVPIYARVMPEGKPNNLPVEYTAFSFNKDNFLMTSATPSLTDGYVLINVRELDGKRTPLQILDSKGVPVEFSIVNAIEEPLQKSTKQFIFEPYGNKFIKVKF